MGVQPNDSKLPIQYDLAAHTETGSHHRDREVSGQHLDRRERFDTLPSVVWPICHPSSKLTLHTCFPRHMG